LTLLILLIMFGRRFVYHTSGCYLTSDSHLCLIRIMLHFHSGFLKLCISVLGCQSSLLATRKIIDVTPTWLTSSGRQRWISDLLLQRR
jgi:hypothetical protein